MWGFMQGQMWRADAYLIDTSYNLTVRGQRYNALMKEWTTNDSNTTNGAGKVSFRGFHGAYRIKLSKTGEPNEIYTIELEPGQTPAQFVLKRYTSDVGTLGSWVTGTTHAKESGTNRALVFIAHARHNSTAATSLTSVTYGGRAMTKVVEKLTSSGSTRTYTAAFILNEADINAATTATFTPTWSTAPATTAYGSVLLSNVDQSALTGATASDEITTGTLLTTPMLATNPGDKVIGAATCSATGNYTMNNSFTEVNEFTMTSADAVDGYKDANGAEEVPSVTHSTSGNRQTAIGFVVVRAPANELILSDCDAVQDANYGLLSDLNGDCYVDSNDLKIISYYWLNTGCAVLNDCDGADFAPTDGDVDFFDFARFAPQWLWCNNPEDSNCTPNW